VSKQASLNRSSECVPSDAGILNKLNCSELFIAVNKGSQIMAMLNHFDNLGAEKRG
jgi:hypothetical protein